MHTRLRWLALAVLLAPAPAGAEWPGTLEITHAASDLASADDGASGAWFVWADDSSVGALHVDAAGARIASWGVPVQGTHVRHLAAAPASSHGVYLGWVSSDGSAWLQHLDASGAVMPGWPAGGWQFSTVTRPTILREIFELGPDGLGGVYAAWSNEFIRLTRVQSNGTTYPGWLANGKIIGSTNVPFAWIPDGQGGTWYAAVAADRARAERRDGSGILVSTWQSDLLLAGTYEVPMARVAAYADGGAAVAWTWWGTDDSPRTALTRLLPNGAPAPGWPPAGGWLPVSSDGCATSVHVDALGSILLPWISEPVQGRYEGAIRMNRLMPDGTYPPGWTASGFPIPGASASCYSLAWSIRQPGFHPDDQGGLFALFNDPLQETRLLRIAADGSVANGWPAAGVRLRVSPASTHLQLVPETSGGVIASWRRDDSGSAEANHVNADGSLGPPPNTGIPGVQPRILTFFPPRPNPARFRAEFEIVLPAGLPATVAVFDTQGRLTRRLAAATLPAGVHRLGWNLEDRNALRVRPGVYLVRAVAGGGTVSRRLIVTE